jgi:uncharacterized protein YodC (DUF2158 family)
MTKDFRVGDVVRLRSGSPGMTVAKVGQFSSDTVECKWFNFGTGEMEWGIFEPPTIVHMPKRKRRAVRASNSTPGKQS